MGATKRIEVPDIRGVHLCLIVVNFESYTYKVQPSMHEVHLFILLIGILEFHVMQFYNWVYYHVFVYWKKSFLSQVLMLVFAKVSFPYSFY